MNKSVINKKVEINATSDKVWRVFTDPVVTRQMGGEYNTDWKVGSPFGWVGKDGKMYTNGSILKLIPKALLQHNLFNPENKTQIMSVITYRLQPGTHGKTLLIAHEDLKYEMTDQEYEAVSEGWDSALKALKETAEKL